MTTPDLFESERINFNVYRSGASSKADAIGIVNAGVPLGITAMDSSSNVLDIAAEYASRGGNVFVDSGAFRLVRTGGTIDYAVVISRYRYLMERTQQPSNLLLVAPDVVGDQKQSIEMLSNWLVPVRELIDSGAQVMVPIQKGAIQLEMYWRKVSASLDREFVVGLPSNAAAIPEKEVLSFLKAVRPAAVHFLGCRANCLVHKAQFASPATVITSDASTLRSHLGKGRALTELHKSLAEENCHQALHGRGPFTGFDETEIFACLQDLIIDKLLSNPCVSRLCDALTIPLKALYNAASSPSFWDELDKTTGGYTTVLVSRWWAEETAKAISPITRSNAITELAAQGRI